MPNDVYFWERDPESDVIIKVYVKTGRQRTTREWAALKPLAPEALPTVPAPLWIDEAEKEPAIGMTRLGIKE